MTLEKLRTICKHLPKVTEDIKWGNDLCFCIGGKMFAVASLDTVPVTASFKTSDPAFETLSEREGFKPAPYMAKHSWVFVEDISIMSAKEWQAHITEAYHLIKAKLPKKFLRENGLD